MHSFMLVRHGHVVAEAWWAPESADKPHILWSLSKSFTSAAVGLSVLVKGPSDHPGLTEFRVIDLIEWGRGRFPIVNAD
ncbi:MAG TPA: hypothetical protein EYQ50_01125 [Verrucomicrobiales bacterium]|nr:hypothetical protein [Verrucomicrobiales bacterium]